MMLDRVDRIIGITLSDEENEVLDDNSFLGLSKVLQDYLEARRRARNHVLMTQFFERYKLLSTGDQNAVHGIFAASEARNTPSKP